jgi:hypothetical protein
MANNKNKQKYVVWCIEDICREKDDDWRNNLYYMCIFSDIKIAKSYVSLLDDLEEYTRNNSRNPDWGHEYFIQKYNEECFIIKEIDDHDDEVYIDISIPNIHYSEYECKKIIKELYENKSYQKYTLRYKAIGPFLIQDYSERDECYIFDNVVSDDEDKNKNRDDDDDDSDSDSDSDNDYYEEGYAIETKKKFIEVFKKATKLREENQIFID